MANNFCRDRPLNVFSIKPMTTAPEWIARSVSRLRGSRAAEGAPTAAQAAKVEVERSTHERLQATLRRGNEALSPRALRRLLADPLKRRIFNLSMGAMLVVLAASFLR